MGSISVFTSFDGWVATSVYLDQIILLRHQKTVFKTIERSQSTPILKLEEVLYPILPLQGMRTRDEGDKGLVCAASSV